MAMDNKIMITEMVDGRYLLEAEDNKLLGLRVADTAARILFTDHDANLIKAAEAKAAALGKKSITCNYADRYDELNSLFEEGGYEMRESKSLLSVDMVEILSSREVRKAMALDFVGTEWIPFRDLLSYQFDELESLFRSEGIIIPREELTRFDPDISGLVYDEQKRICSFILSSTQADDILIECLHGTKKETPRYIMAALKGFATEIYNCDLEDIYKNFTMIEFNPKVRAILKKLLDDHNDINEVGKVMHAHKVLSGDYKGDLPTEKENNSAAQRAAIVAMESRLERQRFQNNINWKSRWNLK